MNVPEPEGFKNTHQAYRNPGNGRDQRIIRRDPAQSLSSQLVNHTSEDKKSVAKTKLQKVEVIFEHEVFGEVTLFLTGSQEVQKF